MNKLKQILKTLVKARIPFMLLYICMYLIADNSYDIEQYVTNTFGCSRFMAMFLIVIACGSVYLLCMYIQIKVEDNPQ